MENNEGCSQGGQEGMVPPNLLQNCTCKKFKSGKILREGVGMKQAVVCSCMALLNMHVYHRSIRY